MAEYITLLGAEDVRRAASIMQQAADTMVSAASQMETSLHFHRQYLDEWLMRLEQALKRE